LHDGSCARQRGAWRARASSEFPRAIGYLRVMKGARGGGGAPAVSVRQCLLVSVSVCQCLSVSVSVNCCLFVSVSVCLCLLVSISLLLMVFECLLLFVIGLLASVSVWNSELWLPRATQSSGSRTPKFRSSVLELRVGCRRVGAEAPPPPSAQLPNSPQVKCIRLLKLYRTGLDIPTSLS